MMHRVDRSGVYTGLVGRTTRLALRLAAVFSIVWLLCWIFAGNPEVGRIERLSDAAYLALQLFFANAESGATSHPVIRILRMIAPLIIPLLGVLAAVKALGVRLALRWKAFLFRSINGAGLKHWLRRSLATDLVVVIGLGQKGRETVIGELTHTRRSGARPVSVVVVERSPDNPAIWEVESLGALVWVGEGESLEDLKIALWKVPTRVWIMTGSSRDNLMILDKVAGLLRKSYEWERSRQRTDLYAHISSFQERRDISLIPYVNRDCDRVWTHVFNRDEKVAERLLATHPLAVSSAGTVPRVLLVGAGGLGISILRELLLLCHFPASEDRFDEISRRLAESPLSSSVKSRDLHDARFPEVVIVDSNSKVEERLLEELPLFKRPMAGVSPFVATTLTIENALTWDLQHYSEKLRQGVPFTHVFIVIGSEVNNIVMGERIWAWEKILTATTGEMMPRIVPVTYDSDAADWLTVPKGLGIEDFEARNFLVLEEGGIDGNVLETAQRINHVYRHSEYLNQAAAEKSLKIESPDWNMSAVQASWTSCLEHDRRSNLAAARYYISLASRSPVDDSEMSQKIKCEHRRWVGYTLVEGVTQVQQSDSKEERVRDGAPKLRQLARVNKNLLPFEWLDDKTRYNDVVIVRSLDYILGKAKTPMEPVVF